MQGLDITSCIVGLGHYDKLLYYLAILPIPNIANIWCPCSLSSSFLKGSWSANVPYLSNTWHSFMSSLTCKEKVLWSTQFQ